MKPIHKAKLDHWLEAKEEWEYARYKRQKQRTSFSQAMADNGNLLIFEAESDTVVNLSYKGEVHNYIYISNESEGSASGHTR